MPLGNYREVKYKLDLADSLIVSFRSEIEILKVRDIAFKNKAEGLEKINNIQLKQIQTLQEGNKKLLIEYEKAVFKKWYEKPSLYFVTGLVIGFIVTR